MDFFTPEVIIAIVTGVFSIITVLLKMNRETRLSRVTDERTKWRKEIRKIVKNLSIVDFDNMDKNNEIILIENLASLKMRLNSYGAGKKDYLKDSHIWDSISKLEDKEIRNNDEKSKLIEYLSLLLKYDWERTKHESSINVMALIGYFIYIISNVLFAYFAYNDFVDTTIYTLLMVILLFSTIFFSPMILLSLFKLFGNKNSWCELLSSYGGVIFFLILLLYQLKADPSSDIGTLDFPIFLQIIALICITVSKFGVTKNNSDYCRLIRKIDLKRRNKVEIEKSKTIQKKPKTNKKKPRVNKEKSKKRCRKIRSKAGEYRLFDCMRLLFILIGKLIKYACCFIVIKWFIPLKNKEQKGINSINKKMDEMKNTDNS